MPQPTVIEVLSERFGPQQTPVFDDETKFLSLEFIGLVSICLSAALLIPILWRLVELRRHEKGPTTICGQLATIGAIAVPTMYLGYLTISWNIEPTARDWFIIGVGALVSCLEFVQDGRVQVCCPELQLFWAGKSVLHSSWALDSVLRRGLLESKLPLAVAAISVLTLILELYNPQRWPQYEQDQQTVFALGSSSYIMPLIEKYRDQNDIKCEEFPLPSRSASTRVGMASFDHWIARVPLSSRWGFTTVILAVQSSSVLVVTMIDVIMTVVELFQPALLQSFLASLAAYADGRGPIYVSYYWAVACSACSMVSVVLDNISASLSEICSQRTRLGIVGLLYRKALNLTPAGRQRFNAGKIMNLVNSDTDYVSVIPNLVKFFTLLPISVALSWWQLWQFLGPTFLSALLVYMVMLPLSAFLTRLMSKGIDLQTEATDERTEETSNLFKNIKTVKMHAWEAPFAHRIINGSRQRELHQQRYIMWFIVLLDEIWDSMESFVAMVVFGTYLWFEQGELSAEVIFPALLLLTIASSPFLLLPYEIQTVAHYWTSQRRISEFLMEADDEHLNFDQVFDSPSLNSEEALVVATDAKLSWDGTDENVAVDRLNLRAKRGDLVCLTGPVGSGKTGLLKGLLGEITVMEGDVILRGHVAYCAQEAWIQNLTLRENIQFGQQVDEEWYQAVITACELRADVEMLPDGDETELGVRGVALSGGQKARLSLARAVYSKADIYLMDDVLSAVDEHVAGNLIRNIFSAEGLLYDKTVVLATHSMRILPHSSLIVSLDQGRIIEQERFENVCRAGEDSKMYQLLSEFGGTSFLKHTDDVKARPTAPHLDPALTKFPGGPMEVLPADARLGIEKGEEESENERKAHNNIGVYLRYLEFMAPKYVLWVGLGLLASTTLSNVSLAFLGSMANQRFVTLADASGYFTVYCLLVLGTSIINLLTNGLVYVVVALDVSKSVHDSMLMRVVRAPLSFFNVTPLGTLINRFNGDLTKLDDSIPFSIMILSVKLAEVLLSTCIIVVTSPITIFIIAPAVWMSEQVRRVFTPVRQIVTEMGVRAFSPILTHVEDSISGIATVRGFNRTEQFLKVFELRGDTWAKTRNTGSGLDRWIGFRCALISSGLSLGCAWSVTSLVSRGTISIGFAGVLNNFALRIGVLMTDFIHYMVTAGINTISLQRIVDYLNLGQEAASHTPVADEAGWPKQGSVRIDKLRLRYGPTAPDVIKGISADIKAGEKIGIVGRTGSGKSTLSIALFRIIEAAGGAIYIDGIDISTLGLDELRSKLSIIPQDAQILGGSVRENLDPRTTVDDARLWEVLELCHLKTYVECQKDGLDHLLSDSGESLSRGQSQLLCLGRALIHESPVLVLDEATASVDVETDQKVQETIRSQFKNHTVITIAHRLNTIIDSDRVLVLNAGEIKEFDTPDALLAIEGGEFQKLYRENHEDPTST